MVDKNSGIVSYSKRRCFHPKWSKGPLPICTAITVATRAVEQLSESTGKCKWKYEERNSPVFLWNCCVDEMKEGYFLVVGHNSQTWIWSGQTG